VTSGKILQYKYQTHNFICEVYKEKFAKHESCENLKSVTT